MSLELVNIGLDEEHLFSKAELGIYIPSFNVDANTSQNSKLGINYINLIDGAGKIGLSHAVDYEITSSFIGTEPRINQEQEYALIKLGLGQRLINNPRTLANANVDLWHGTLASQYYLDNWQKTSARADKADGKFIKGGGLALLGVIVGDVLYKDVSTYVGIGEMVATAVPGFLYVCKGLLIDDFASDNLYGKSMKKTRNFASELANQYPVLEAVN